MTDRADPLRIAAPGIYREIDVTAYHDDPTPEPSFSQSIAKIIIDRSPLHAATAHPRLLPAAPVDDEAEKYVKAKAIGDAAHALMIGRGKKITVADFDSWRSDKAKTARAEAEAAGKLPILAKHFATAERIAIAARQQLDQHEDRDCFTNGTGEVALVWQENGLWFRCLVDWLHDDLLATDDLKTTAMSVAEHVLGLRAADAGWHLQAAMIERGLDALDPDNAGRRRFRFVALEQEPPYALNVMRMSEAWLTMGRKQLSHAINLWQECMSVGKWHGYPRRTLMPEFPGWMETRWLDREIAHEERRRINEGAVVERLESLMGG